jgi:tetratricopeptide (TPR) repeat protein
LITACTLKHKPVKISVLKNCKGRILEHSMRIIKLLAFLLLTTFILSAPRVIADDDEVTEDANGNLPFGYVRSINAMNSGGSATGASLALAAEYCKNRGAFDQAIKYCQQALVKDNDDLDIHLIYAQSLQGKLRHQKAPKDPDLYMATVYEFLLVARSERGEEKGLTNSKGLGLPGQQHRFMDEGRNIPAMAAIKQLVGYTPGPKETDMKFLKRVAKQCEYSAKGVIIPKSVADKKGDSDKKGGATAEADASSTKGAKNQKAAQAKSSDSM